MLTMDRCFPRMSAKFVTLLLFLCFSELAIADPPVTSHIRRRPVVSKGIVSIGYSKRLHVLEIEFVNGAIYRYTQVAPSVHRELMAAGSKARYYDANIKGNYPSVRVRPRAKQ
jgi:hypothetical protein